MGKWAGPMEVRARSARSLRPWRIAGRLRTASSLPRKKGRNFSRAMRQPAWASRSAACASEGGGQAAGGHVRPEDELGVAGHPALERGAGVIVGGRDLVEDLAAGGEEAAIAGPSEAEGQVDVLVIRAVERDRSRRRGGAPRPGRRRSSRWRRRPRRRGGRPPIGRLAVASLGGPAAERCTNRRPSRRDSGRSGREPAGLTEPTVGSAKGARPASIQPCDNLGVVIEQLDEMAPGGGDSGVGRGAEAAVSLEPDQPDARVMGGQPGGRAVGRAVVDDDDLDARLPDRRGGGERRWPGRSSGGRGRCRSGSRPSREAPRHCRRGDAGRVAGRSLVDLLGGRDRFHEVFPQTTC